MEHTSHGKETTSSPKRNKDYRRTHKCHDKTNLLRECCESRKKERINEDDSFKSHQKGPITTTFTVLQTGSFGKGSVGRNSGNG
jgi:hypothetical protein